MACRPVKEAHQRQHTPHNNPPTSILPLRQDLQIQSIFSTFQPLHSPRLRTRLPQLPTSASSNSQMTLLTGFAPGKQSTAPTASSDNLTSSKFGVLVGASSPTPSNQRSSALDKNRNQHQNPRDINVTLCNRPLAHSQEIRYLEASFSGYLNDAVSICTCLETSYR